MRYGRSGKTSPSSSSIMPSACLSMRRVLAAPLAIFRELDAIAGIGLVLGRHVVAAFTHVARQRDRRPLVGWHGSCFLIPRELGWRARRSPPSVDSLFRPSVTSDSRRLYPT